jgi:hypothetical protein
VNFPIINITRVEQAGEHCLRLWFDDGSEQTVDFGPFLREAQHPDVGAFLQPDKFRSFRLEQGDLLWGDYELCFPVADLHANNLLQAAATRSAAA